MAKRSTARVLTNPIARTPDVHLLSNGRYHVAISSAGGGYSRWRDLALTRWREDATRDCWGTFVYLRDVATGEFWSTALPADAARDERLRGHLHPGAAPSFASVTADLEIHTELCVSPEDDVELRRITLDNHSSDRAHHRADQLRGSGARDAGRGRSASRLQQSVRANRIRTRVVRHSLHPPRPLARGKAAVAAASDGRSRRRRRGKFRARRIASVLSAGAEPWRARPRCRTTAPLSNTAGSVLDPIISLRRTVTLAPNETAVLDFVIGVTENREGALALVEKYQHVAHGRSRA